MNPIDSALAQAASLIASLEKDPKKSILVEDSDKWFVSAKLSKPNLYAVRFSWNMGNGSRSYGDLLSQDIAVNRIAICILYKEKKHPEVLKFSASLIRGIDSERLYHTSLDMIFTIFKSLYDNEQEDEALTFLSSLDKENPYFSISLRLHLLQATEAITKWIKPSIAKDRAKRGLFSISSEQRIRLITSSTNKEDLLKEVYRRSENSISSAQHFFGRDLISVFEKDFKEKSISKY